MITATRISTSRCSGISSAGKNNFFSNCCSILYIFVCKEICLHITFYCCMKLCLIIIQQNIINFHGHFVFVAMKQQPGYPPAGAGYPPQVRLANKHTPLRLSLYLYLLSSICMYVFTKFQLHMCIYEVPIVYVYL